MSVVYLGPNNVSACHFRLCGQFAESIGSVVHSVMTLLEVEWSHTG